MNKASGGNGIPAELFQILKDDAGQVLHSICQQIWKTQQWPQDWKRSFSFQSQRKVMSKMLKLPHNCTDLTRQQSNAQNSPSQASTVHEPRTSRCSSWIQKRQRNQRSNCHICWIIEEQGNSRNISTSVSLTMLKPLTVWIITNYKTFLKRWEYQTALPVS